MNVRMRFARCRQYVAIMPLLLMVVGFLAAGSSVAVAEEEDAFEALGIARISEPLEVADFSLASIDGGKKSLGDFAGKVILLNFWTTW